MKQNLAPEKILRTALCFLVMLTLVANSGCTTTHSGHDEQNLAQPGAPNKLEERWRVITSVVDVDATVEEVWNDWTTVQGQEAIFTARVILELRPMGLHEVWFLPDAPAGQRGHESGRIIGWQDQTMLAFTWTMPPYMPGIRPHQTFVQLFIEPLADARTRISLYHTGFGTGTEWDEGYQYFLTVWPAVLSGYTDTKSRP